MDLTLSGDIAKQIITLTKKDSKLAQALARQFLTSIEPAAMAGYLLTPDIAVSLLADRISKNPEQTLRQLQGLTARRVPAASKRGAARGGRRRKRHRLTSDEIQRIKSEVRGFLGRHPWSNRKQIGEAVTFPSLAAYNRIMAELRREGAVQAQGEKSKTVYAVKAGNGRSRGKRRAPRTRSKAKAKAKAE